MFYEQKGKIYCSKTMETIENNRNTLTKKFFLYYRVAHTILGKLDQIWDHENNFSMFYEQKGAGGASNAPPPSPCRVKRSCIEKMSITLSE